MSKELFFDMRAEELSAFVDDVERGNLNALRAYAEIKDMESYVSQARKQIEPIALEEAEKYPEKTFDFENWQIQKRAGAVRYNYNGIKAYQEKKAELKAIEDRAKQAYLARQKGMLTATEDGEEIELPEPVYSKDSLVIKKK